MNLSVVVPTLNGRDQLAGTLDGLAEHAPQAEVIVVNGPSADGTTGMVRDRDDVDVLIEIADRGCNVARNVGIDYASGDAVALLNNGLVIEDGWEEAVTTELADGTVVTGPTHRELKPGLTTEHEESTEIKHRPVTYFNGGNVAFSQDVLDALDGFDEYLLTGGSRDVAHRLAGLGHDVVWNSEMSVRSEYGTDGGTRETDWGWTYRALAYSLTKNYGPRPTVFARVLAHGGKDAVSVLKEVVTGTTDPSSWLGNGRDVLTGIATGLKDGVIARARDRSSRRNPRGRSTRADRAVAVYDWR